MEGAPDGLAKVQALMQTKGARSIRGLQRIFNTFDKGGNANKLMDKDELF